MGSYIFEMGVWRRITLHFFPFISWDSHSAILYRSVGEFVIPSLLGGSETLMIGRTLYDEFFQNRDWPVSSAVAIILLLILIVPIMLFQHSEAKARAEGR